MSNLCTNCVFSRVACQPGLVRLKAPPATVLAEPFNDNDCCCCVTVALWSQGEGIPLQCGRLQHSSAGVRRRVPTRLGLLLLGLIGCLAAWQLCALSLPACPAFSRTVCGNPRDDHGNLAMLPRLGCQLRHWREASPDRRGNVVRSRITRLAASLTRW